ncbi:hypothetical protein JOM56_012885 [Amanita muscaria]
MQGGIHAFRVVQVRVVFSLGSAAIKHLFGNSTFIWWIIPGLLVKSGKKWDCTGTLPGLLVFYRGGDLAGNTAKLHQASTGTLPGLSGKVLAIYQDFTVITRYGNSISTDGFL